MKTTKAWLRLKIWLKNYKWLKTNNVYTVNDNSSAIYSFRKFIAHYSHFFFTFSLSLPLLCSAQMENGTNFPSNCRNGKSNSFQFFFLLSWKPKWKKKNVDCRSSVDRMWSCHTFFFHTLLARLRICVRRNEELAQGIVR